MFVVVFFFLFLSLCRASQPSFHWINVAKGPGVTAEMVCAATDGFLFAQQDDAIYTFDTRQQGREWTEEESNEITRPTVVSLASGLLESTVIVVRGDKQLASYDLNTHETRKLSSETRGDGCMLAFSPSQLFVLNEMGEVHVFDGNNWREEITMAMPSARSRHACSRLDERTLMLVGGLQPGGEVPSAQVWLLDIQDGVWLTNALPHLPLLGIYDALVATFRQTVIVGGGHQTTTTTTVSLTAPAFFRLLDNNGGGEWIPLNAPRLPDGASACMLSSSARLFLWTATDTYELVSDPISPHFSSSSSSSSSPSTNLVVFIVLTVLIVLFCSIGIICLLLASRKAENMFREMIHESSAYQRKRHRRM